ncbi:sigma-70 family RNA polymerase sigma factor [Streptomyces lichenis]|uniref:Sigma-70 family RNA polymerase sigma factor n=1 Tax=Streptomyces lichenis TaxID=2306967 RepID=A0ABT0IFK8_9ACTN|nr:sigma-70 family RNA polymerase sigma factor [Streptomyces lichenis]MCK8680118.1 sigma-70 family RNA polymerase sigma factor [Streptomyces lichenis]
MTGIHARHPGRIDPAVPADGRSDAELGGEVRRAGDEAALAELYRRHHPAALAYARTFARDPHTAEDLASEAFARVLRAVRSGAGPETAWRPYLLTVVRHTAGEWAATARRTELSEDFEQWLDERVAADPAAGGVEYAGGEERMVALEERSMVVRGFRALPERWQAALWHSVVEGESAERIGVLLGVSPSGVTSLTARAREGLREAYLRAHAESGSRSEECRRHGPLLAAAVRRGGRRWDRRLRRHLDGCGDCRHAMVELADLDRRLGAVLPVGLLVWGGHTYVSGQLGAVAGVGGGSGAVAGVGSGGGAAGAGSGAGGGAAVAGGKVVAVGAAVVATSALVVGGLLLPDGEEGERRREGASVVGPVLSGVPVRSPEAATPEVSETPSPRATSAEPSPRVSATASASPSASPSPSEWLPKAEDRTRLRLAATDRCMEIPGGSAAVGVQVREAACDGSRRQVWELLRPGDDGRVQIRNGGTGRCLANQGTEADDAPVVQAGCDPSDSRQLWTMYAPAGTGEARFIQEGDRMYLGLNDWWNAAEGKAHTADIGTNRHYYGSSSFGFRYDGALFDG